ncbi:MAG: geranylgeranylglyceryl/heptaprenylglyceryl phosphate synthase [Archaeoglobales archaeon]|nr:MAG: geranylgeranylglyceryl/heptaprenylglyceryl phosphate synthase [Archaeoglobales archaeon]
MRGRVERYLIENFVEFGGLLFGVIDPLDYRSLDDAVETARRVYEGGADVILVGGSVGVQGEPLDYVVREIKKDVDVPIVLFPGNIGTITKYADALYFMSLLNSRNPYWITRAQMLSAFLIKSLKLEVLPVGYIVVEPGGTVGHVGEAELIPRDRPKIASAYALAGQFMGFRFIVTDAGSNPKEGHIPLEMVREVAKTIEVPYIVAGGIRKPEEAEKIIECGADAVQIGTAFEMDNAVDRIEKFVRAVREGGRRKKRKITYE